MTEPMKKEDLPFPKRWLGYIVIKLVVVALALLLALHYYEML